MRTFDEFCELVAEIAGYIKHVPECHVFNMRADSNCPVCFFTNGFRAQLLNHDDACHYSLGGHGEDYNLSKDEVYGTVFIHVDRKSNTVSGHDYYIAALLFLDHFGKADLMIQQDADLMIKQVIEQEELVTP